MIFLAAQFSVALHSGETTAHDNRLYITLGESDDITHIPLTLHIENPTVDITALEMYLNVPDGATLAEGLPDDHRCSDHELVQGQTSDGIFISLASPSLAAIAGSSGAVCTWMLDVSSLSDGTYSIDTNGVLAIGADDNGVTSYKADDQTAQYVIRNGAVTGIEEIEDSAEKAKGIYNLKGQLLSSPQRNTINIINGKKVLLRKI